jgi:uncharacterized coiled-coil DUF342 family protein
MMVAPHEGPRRRQRFIYKCPIARPRTLFVNAMAEDLTEVERKLNALQKEANRLRAQRDDLNGQARFHADARDEQNAKVRGLVNEANEHKKRRDGLNEQVQHMKKLRDELNAGAEEAARKLDDLKRSRLPKQGRSTVFLRRELKRLEFEHMTKVLTPGKEKALIEEMGRLRREIQSKEKELEGDAELKGAYEAATQAKDRAEKQHEKVGELAKRAQEEHEAMVKLFEESDRIRKIADGIQAKFVESKQEADKVHKSYVEMVEKIHSIEDEMKASRHGVAATQRMAEAQADVAQANEIFEKFKRGEKLSTEDLMSLQKAGLL